MYPPIYELELVNFYIRQNHRDALNQHLARKAREQGRQRGVMHGLRTRIMAMVGSLVPNGGPEHDPRKGRPEIARADGRTF